MGRSYVRSFIAYVLVAAGLWYALHHGGIHATISGVIAGLAIPARARRLPRTVLEDLSVYTAGLLRTPEDEELDNATVLNIEERIEDVESPLGRFVHALHPWVAFVIMPVFALANSGVDLRALEPSQLTSNLAVGIAVALFIGKLVGIFSCTWLAVRTGLSPMPGNASLVKLVGVSTVAGIGFTVALFIAGLAYPANPELLDQAKVGILAGSLISGIVGSVILRLTRPVGADVREEQRLAASAHG
jgi:NhaA family Na+:H+ antiporter